jgi:hypothetical protein
MILIFRNNSPSSELETCEKAVNILFYFNPITVQLNLILIILFD